MSRLNFCFGSLVLIRIPSHESAFNARRQKGTIAAFRRARVSISRIMKDSTKDLITMGKNARLWKRISFFGRGGQRTPAPPTVGRMVRSFWGRAGAGLSRHPTITPHQSGRASSPFRPEEFHVNISYPCSCQKPLLLVILRQHKMPLPLTPDSDP